MITSGTFFGKNGISTTKMEIKTLKLSFKEFVTKIWMEFITTWSSTTSRWIWWKWLNTARRILINFPILSHEMMQDSMSSTRTSLKITGSKTSCSIPTKSRGCHLSCLHHILIVFASTQNPFSRTSWNSTAVTCSWSWPIWLVLLSTVESESAKTWGRFGSTNSL